MAGTPRHTIPAAAELARTLVAPLGRRWARVQAVAARAEQLRPAVAPAEGDTLVMAAWLHDIGYAPTIGHIRFHPLDGARHLRATGWPEPVVDLVAHHSGARYEAEQRGLSAELAAYPFHDSPLDDALATADLTTGPDGTPLLYAERIAEILTRHHPRTPSTAPGRSLAPSSPTPSVGPEDASQQRLLHAVAARRVEASAGSVLLQVAGAGPLYVVIGQATALMASTAFDLNRWNDAEAMVRSAGKYANLAGDAALESWTLGLRATLANWRSEPETAAAPLPARTRDRARRCTRVRLRYIASRSHALLNDAGAVRDVLHSAERDRDDAATHQNRLTTEVGGEFAFGDARAAACAAAAWLDVRDGDQAEAQGHQALAALASLPSHQQPYSQIAGTQIDIATARAFTANVDGAVEMTRAVLALPANKRNVSLLGRLVRLRDEIADHSPASETARTFREEISAWLQDSEVIRGSELSGTR